MSIFGAKILLAKLFAQEARLAGDRGAIGGARQMSDQRPGDAGIEHHRYPPRRNLARIEPFDRALAGAAADRFRAFEVCGVQRRGEIVVGFHAGAFSGDSRHRDAVARADRGALKAAAGDQHSAADAGGGRRAARLGDAGDGKTCGFRLCGALFQNLDRGHVGIEQIQLGEFVREQRRVGQSGVRIVGRGARHGDGTLRQRIEAAALQVVGRDHRLLAADEDAQADVVAFGALRFLDGAVAHFDRERDRAQGHGIGLIGAGALGGGDETMGEIGEGGLIEQRRHRGVFFWLFGSGNTRRAYARERPRDTKS